MQILIWSQYTHSSAGAGKGFTSEQRGTGNKVKSVLSNFYGVQSEKSDEYIHFCGHSWIHRAQRGSHLNAYTIVND